VVSVRLPALRERAGDVVLLASHFLDAAMRQRADLVEEDSRRPTPPRERRAHRGRAADHRAEPAGAESGSRT
jgi:hypothetical protein